MAADIAPDYCPPHDFRAGWQTEEKGVIYCRCCGEIRDLEAQKVGAPDLERIPEKTGEGGIDPSPRK